MSYSQYFTESLKVNVLVLVKSSGLGYTEIRYHC